MNVRFPRDGNLGPIAGGHEWADLDGDLLMEADADDMRADLKASPASSRCARTMREDPRPGIAFTDSTGWSM